MATPLMTASSVLEIGTGGGLADDRPRAFRGSTLAPRPPIWTGRVSGRSSSIWPPMRPAEAGKSRGSMCVDQGPAPQGRREGLRRLLAVVRAGAVQGVVVRSLSHLAQSLRQLSDLGHLLDGQGVSLIAPGDHLDTTDPGGAIRWRDWLDISGRLDRELRSEAAKLARLCTPGGRWGRPAAVVNPLELLTWWEGRGGRRPLSLRELARKLGVSEATARKRLRDLRAAGQVDDGARARALAARGGLTAALVTSRRTQEPRRASHHASWRSRFGRSERASFGSSSARYRAAASASVRRRSLPERPLRTSWRICSSSSWASVSRSRVKLFGPE